MNWFVITCSLIYLGVLLFMNVVRFFVGEAFQEGLVVVPILLMANLFLGVFFNLSIWFKLNDKTYLGAWLAVMGSILTIALNYFLIPAYGYVGASWATFVVYLLMMIASYLLGQKYYPVNYNLYKVIGYPALVTAICWMYIHSLPMDGVFSWVLKGSIIFLFLCLVYYIEIRKKQYFHHPKPQNK